MPATVTEEDFDTCILLDHLDTEFKLVSYEYLAYMAGYGDGLERYDTGATCVTCKQKDYQKLWSRIDDSGIGSWHCVDCLLNEANGDDSPYSWYVLVK